jgi:hypothetical protein
MSFSGFCLRAVQALEVRRVADPRPRLERSRVAGDPRASEPDLDAVGPHDHLDVLADVAMRHAVANGVDIDKTVNTHASGQPSSPHRQRPHRQGPQRLAFVTLKTDAGLFVCSPVNALVGDLDDPLCQVPLQGLKGDERPAGQGVVLDRADAAFDLPLGTGASWSAGTGGDAAVLRRGRPDKRAAASSPGRRS